MFAFAFRIFRSIPFSRPNIYHECIICNVLSFSIIFLSVFPQFNGFNGISTTISIRNTSNKRNYSIIFFSDFFCGAQWLGKWLGRGWARIKTLTIFILSRGKHLRGSEHLMDRGKEIFCHAFRTEFRQQNRLFYYLLFGGVSPPHAANDSLLHYIFVCSFAWYILRYYFFLSTILPICTRMS